MLVLTVTLLWLLSDDSFRVRASSVSFEGIEHADEAAIREQLEGIDRAPNVFRVRASDLVADLGALPEVRAASAMITLPAHVSVRIHERVPLFAWSDGEQGWLVDAEGVLFARASRALLGLDDIDPGLELAAESAAEPAAQEPIDDDQSVEDLGPDDLRAESLDMEALELDTPGRDSTTDDDPVTGESIGDKTVALPVIQDDRLPDAPLEIGSRLSDIDLAVMRQLLAVTPGLLGSRSESISLSIDQLDGYVLRGDLGWQAVFGHYTPTLQPPEVVPRQVQCLTWLLASRERRLERVRLAISEDGCGSFTRFGGRN